MGKFGLKNVKVIRFNWKLTQWYLGSADFESELSFWISDPRIHFWANLGWKSQSSAFFLKIGTHGISMMLILIWTLIFWIFNPKSIFGKIWIKLVKVVQFGWKLAHRVSRRCWFLFWHYFSQFPTLNHILDKFGPKNSKSFILTKNCWFLFWQ